jgi:SM-20-related protein
VINPNQNYQPFALALKTHAHVQIPNFFEQAAANELHQCLVNDVPFEVLLRDASGQRAMPLAQAFEAIESSTQHAATHFAFCYEGYQMVPAYMQGRDPGLLLHRLLDFFNSANYLQFMRNLTSTPSLRRIDAQATRYRAGHFLKRHNDISGVEQRRFAYVLNLSQDWQAHYGGLLQLMDDADNVTHTYMPHFNSLTIFQVPTWHCVSNVASFAQGARLAITGWLQD